MSEQKFTPQFNGYGEAYAHMAAIYAMCQEIDFEVSPHECWKVSGVIPDMPFLIESAGHVHNLEGAVAIIEGKPAFRGDVLYDVGDGAKYEICGRGGSTSAVSVIAEGWPDDAPTPIADLSWNPPKPKTVCINGVDVSAPLTIEPSDDAERADIYGTFVTHDNLMDRLEFIAALAGKPCP